MPRQRSSVILDAGYVAIQTNATTIQLGLQGKKLVFVVTLIFTLIFFSCVNLSCLIWIMYHLDWSPFHRENGSKIFRYDRLNNQILFHEQGRFDDGFYTTRLRTLSSLEWTTEDQVDVYGNQNSIFLDHTQIALNTESFYLSDEKLVQFDRLSSFQFDSNRTTRIHLDRIGAEHIHQKTLHLMAKEQLTVDQVNRVFLSSHNLTLTTDPNNRRSILRFQNHPMKRKSSFRRFKNTLGNIEFRSEVVYLDLPRYPSVSPASTSTERNDLNIYRLCLCNTSFLLLRSFAHQPCPLC